jgi:hypothetical protein
MPEITQTNAVWYNGFQFNRFTKTHVSSKAVPDRAGRTTKLVELTVSAPTYNSAEGQYGTTENEIEELRHTLMQKGKNLMIQSMGFGPFDINNLTNMTLLDVTYGPHPQSFDFVQLGGDRAWLVKWVCVTTIADQADRLKGAGNPLAYCHTWAVDTDEHGYSTRHVAGEYEIPAARVVGRNLPDNADRYWQTIIEAIPMLPGFTRNSSHRLSDDKRTLSFEITDTEMPPAGFIESMTGWEGSQDVSTSLADGWHIFHNNITATYKVSRDRPKPVAMERFMRLLNSRLDVTRAGIGQGGAPAGIRALIPVAARVTDKIHTSEVTFSFTYRYALARLDDALQASGVWQPVPDSVWQNWQNSMRETVAHPRGNARLFYDNASDAIIDIIADD